MPVFHTGDSCLASAVVACEAHDEGISERGSKNEVQKLSLASPLAVSLLLLYYTPACPRTATSNPSVDLHRLARTRRRDRPLRRRESPVEVPFRAPAVEPGRSAVA